MSQDHAGGKSYVQFRQGVEADGGFACQELEPAILCTTSCSDDDAPLTPRLETTEGVMEGDEMESSHPRNDGRARGTPGGEGDCGE